MDYPDSITLTRWVCTLLMVLSLTGGSLHAQEADLRNVGTGWPIFSNGYIDQPYVVQFDDGLWLTVFTTGAHEEGAGGQHIVAATSTDRGQTWSAPVPIEPSTGPAASWAMPYLTRYGRVYVFYVYNGDGVETLRDRPIRNDMLGWYAFRYSDDRGQTWSARYRLPVRTTAVDRGNDWGGAVHLLWGIGKPVDVDDGMMFGFTKLGRYMLDEGEGWFFRSDNINTERDPQRLDWQMLPEGDHGVRNPAFGSVQEEHNLVQLADGTLYTIYRTRLGHPAHSYSRDGGKTWSLPEIATYADGSPIKNPRACPRIWKTTDGRYLLWYHNHSGDYYADRNPAWLAGGIERDGRILWSQPEILLYEANTTYASGRFSYPDLVEAGGQYWVTATNKVEGRVHPVSPALLEGLWRQFEPPQPVDGGLVLDVEAAALTRSTLRLGGRWPQGEGGLVLLDTAADTGGVTLDLTLRLDHLAAGQILFDSRDGLGNGLYLQTTGYRQLEAVLTNGRQASRWSTDPGLLDVVGEHHVTLILDNGPNLILFVVNGRLGDGRTSRQYGWGRFAPYLGRIRSSAAARIAPGRLRGLRLYRRALRVSEAIAGQRLRMIP